MAKCKKTVSINGCDYTAEQLRAYADLLDAHALEPEPLKPGDIVIWGNSNLFGVVVQDNIKNAVKGLYGLSKSNNMLTVIAFGNGGGNSYTNYPNVYRRATKKELETFVKGYKE